ncbi:unnamed protein product [Cunninghamella echinulata]
MSAIDRKDYCEYSPYQDSPQTIGYGVTISAPHMHAYALEQLEKFLQPGMKALDVGSGSGYLTACMAEMVGPNGRAIGIEHISELVDYSIKNVRKRHSDWIDSGRIKFVVGDGRLGYTEDAKYDCIHVGAASPKKPTELIEQLKAPGRLFVPVGQYQQNIIVYDKKEDGTVEEQKIMGVIYVPLTDADKQRGTNHSY